MKTYLSMMPIAVLLLVLTNSAATRAQDCGGPSADDEAPAVIFEAFPDRVPFDAAPAVPPPTPRSLGVTEAFQDGVNIHTLAEVTAEETAAADQAFEESPCHDLPGPARLGIVRQVEPEPLVFNRGFAATVDPASGEIVWTAAIRSPGAYGLRIHFSTFHVERGSVLVYAQGRDDMVVRGPYTGWGPSGRGDFWTASLPGDTAYVEVVGTADASIEIAEIVHFDHDPAGSGGAGPDREFPCHLDVMCEDDPPVSAIARDATGKMNWVCGDFASACTGTVLNDEDPETWVPYFLTAYHCLHTQAEVDTMEVVWLWQQPQCDPNDPNYPAGTLPDYWTLPRICGGTLLATNPTSGGNDMTFIRLDGELPGGIPLAGWTTNRPDSAVGIHHPDTGAGSWKRVVFLSDVGFCPGCSGCGDPTDYDFYDIDDGIIEPGSSGSGVFNYSGQLAGQLFGSCCPNVFGCDSFGCSTTDQYTAMYGEFETTYPIIDYWLELGGTLHVDHTYLCLDQPPCAYCGLPGRPYTNVGGANDCAWDGTRIKIQAGSYPETLTFSKRLTVMAEGGTVVIGE